MDFASIRRDYRAEPLDESSVDRDPMAQFLEWLRQAVEGGLREPNAMALATAEPDGTPHVRMVLLKGTDQGAFVFYTNYNSRKGKDLAANPKAEAVFYWNELERQVRVHGIVAKVSPEESDAYFRTRPRMAQVGAFASRQSEALESRELLERRAEEAETFYRDGEIARPDAWGGYRLMPQWMEFWQGRPNRLHDRIRCDKDGAGLWTITRLYP